MKELVERNFHAREDPQAGSLKGKTKFRFIDFEPLSEDAKRWAAERVFWLFGGSGNTYNGGKDHPKFIESDRQKMRRAIDMIKSDPGRAVCETEESLRLMEGFLEYLGRPCLATYLTSTLYGESHAYAMRERMEEGERMERLTLASLREGTKRIWFATQLSPYAPYVAMLFCESRKAMRAWHAESVLRKNEVDITDFKPDLAAQISRIAASEVPEYHLVHLWNDLHTLGLSKYYKIRTAAVNGESSLTWSGANGFVLGSQKEPRAVLRFPDAQGFTLTDFEKGLELHRLVDLALISSRQMYEQGKFRFMLLSPSL